MEVHFPQAIIDGLADTLTQVGGVGIHPQFDLAVGDREEILTRLGWLVLYALVQAEDTSIMFGPVANGLNAVVQPLRVACAMGWLAGNDLAANHN
jgi:hypothetical protein